ncbi:hypothetical protein V1478_001406 [Vespula squamosa]|uniref:Maturase K n=1 Tax=Vespula squamosa TaxID=30214 RepID=A0ABD2C1F1_VESSQ
MHSMKRSLSSSFLYSESHRILLHALTLRIKKLLKIFYRRYIFMYIGMFDLFLEGNKKGLENKEGVSNLLRHEYFYSLIRLRKSGIRRISTLPSFNPNSIVLPTNKRREE